MADFESLTAASLLNRFEQTGIAGFPAFTSYGSYPLVYFCAKDCAVLCAKCASAHVMGEFSDRCLPGEEAVLSDVLWEGGGELCSHCEEVIESAYGVVE